MYTQPVNLNVGLREAFNNLQMSGNCLDEVKAELKKYFPEMLEELKGFTGLKFRREATALLVLKALDFPNDYRNLYDFLRSDPRYKIIEGYPVVESAAKYRSASAWARWNATAEPDHHLKFIDLFLSSNY